MTSASRIIVASALLVACTREIPPAAERPTIDEATSLAAQGTATDRVGIAMSGAPAPVASGARIMDFDESGNMVELRAGTNGWMCLVDDTPAAPGNSPDCMDQRWQQWFDAYANREAPHISGIGVAYMLQGSLSPSNSDPFAETPAPGESWMEDGPHVMVIVPDPAILDSFPTDHVTGGPYVMYRGTPYAHLMVPVITH